jgi:hypothetical protein
MGNRMRHPVRITQTSGPKGQTTPDSNLLSTAFRGMLTQKDVKNDDRTDYVYENKGERTECTLQKSPLLHKNVRMTR